MFSEIQMLSRLYDVTIDLTTTFGLPVKGALICTLRIHNRQRRPCALRGDLPSRGDFIETIPWRVAFRKSNAKQKTSSQASQGR